MADPTKRRDSSGSAHIFVCSHPGCRTAFSRNDRLIIHMRTHTGEKPFVCDDIGCGKSYARMAHLKRHVEMSHNKDRIQRKLKCTVEGCDRDFINKTNLNRHIEQIHQRKDYTCQFEGCGQSFRKNHQLKCHETEHTNANPYRCTVENCDKSFKNPRLLQRHQKVHEGYVCTEEGCGVRFEKWTQLWKHRTMAHKPDFICAICQRHFTQKSRLSRHLRTHEERRQVFECPRQDCSRVYTELRNLKAHIRSYHDGHRFSCSVEDCSRSFVSKQKLTQHLRLHDADKPPPKKKSKKGQKRKSMALKLATLGLGETIDQELVDLDRDKLKGNQVMDVTRGNKSASWSGCRSEAGGEAAEGMVIACMDIPSPKRTNNTDSDMMMNNKPESVAGNYPREEDKEPVSDGHEEELCPGLRTAPENGETQITEDREEPVSDEHEREFPCPGLLTVPENGETQITEDREEDKDPVSDGREDEPCPGLLTAPENGETQFTEDREHPSLLRKTSQNEAHASDRLIISEESFSGTKDNENSEQEAFVEDGHQCCHTSTIDKDSQGHEACSVGEVNNDSCKTELSVQSDCDLGSGCHRGVETRNHGASGEAKTKALQLCDKHSSVSWNLDAENMLLNSGDSNNENNKLMSETLSPSDIKFSVTPQILVKRAPVFVTENIDTGLRPLQATSTILLEGKHEQQMYIGESSKDFVTDDKQISNTPNTS